MLVLRGWVEAGPAAGPATADRQPRAERIGLPRPSPAQAARIVAGWLSELADGPTAHDGAVINADAPQTQPRTAAS